MTSVVVERVNGSIAKVRCSGHTGYAEEGEDIICAALSSIVQTALLGLLQVVGINVDYVVMEMDGELEFNVPTELGTKQRLQADAITETMLAGVVDLRQEYSDFIDLEVI